MPTYHTVRQGEWLARIARRYGFQEWRNIYYHPENADFRRLRPDPNLLYPGDRIYIPDRELRVEACATGQRHRFCLRATGDKLLLRLVPATLPLDPDTPRARQPIHYRLNIGHRVIEGDTDAEGLLRVDHLPPDEEEASLEFEGHTVDLRIGHLDPVEELSGVQARLNHLGYVAGPVDGVLGPLTRVALRAFQFASHLPVTGEADAATVERLCQLHER